MKLCVPTKNRSLLFFAVILLALTATSPAYSQAKHGIPSDGTDFFIGMMPGIAPNQGWQIKGHEYLLIGSAANNNTVTISYFDANGNEVQGKTFILQRGICEQYFIDHSTMAPSYPGEQLEFRAAHITSRYPVSVQYYSDGSSAGSMFQAIPTSGLGKKYVVSAWNDNPLKDAPNPYNPDSSSSEFEIIAPYDNTVVTFVPNSTTYSGVVGLMTGSGSDGKTPHPVTLSMSRGQVYWVRSRPEDMSDDLSGSTIVSNKPVAVLGGAEHALIGDPSGFFDEDILDEAVEQMTPVEDWGTDFPAIPTMPASNSNVDQGGDGDLYRLYSDDPKGMNINMWDGTQLYGPKGLALYQDPPADFENISDPIDLVTDPASVDSLGTLKKMYAVQYQYFQGVPQNEESDRSPNEMNLISVDRYIMSTVFMIPNNVTYHGYQFINVITNKDSVTKIFLSHNGQAGTQLGNNSPVKQYSIPLHPELIGMTFRLSPGSYMIYGNTPFACYSYGRTEPLQKDVWGYAAPTGQAYGSHEISSSKISITPDCDGWNIHLHNDLGLADIELIDPNDSSLYTNPPYPGWYNVSMDPQHPTLPPFEVGDTSMDLRVNVGQLQQNAYAAIYVVDRGGNDTVIQLQYTAPKLSLSDSSIAFTAAPVSGQVCSTVVFHVGSTGNQNSVIVSPAQFDTSFDKSHVFSYTSNPTLPASLHNGDSVIFTVCFQSSDTNQHKNQLVMQAGCVVDSIPVSGYAATPIIIADDHDFLNVPVGDTVCALISVQNVGNAPLILDKNWLLHLNPDYSFMSAAILPDTIKPHTSQKLDFCFHPTQKGQSDTRMDWGTNLSGNYTHDEKDTSALLGAGIKAGLNWMWHNQLFTVECARYDTVRLWLQNTSIGNEGADLTVTDIHAIGPDANDFTILDYGTTYQPPWLLSKGDSQYIDVQFHVDPNNGYVDRNTAFVVAGTGPGGPYYDTLKCLGHVRHAIVSLTPATFNFGAQLPGMKVTQAFTVTNTGDTNFHFTTIGLPGSDFTIVSGPNVGDTLAPGLTDTFVIQYLAPAAGGSSQSTLTLLSSDTICEGTNATFSAYSGTVTLSGTGYTFPLTYICHGDTAFVSTTIQGIYGAVLDSVQITNGPNGTGADQFVFADDRSQLKVLNETAQSQTITFPILYQPSKNGNVGAVVNFYWHETDSVDNKYVLVPEPITGIGYASADTLSVANPVVGSNGAYTAVTDGMVTVPVRLAVPLDSVAQIYGVQFTLRYYRDAFLYQPGGIQPQGGLSLVNNPQPVADPADNNYELLPIHLASTTPITTLDPIANVTWQYVIARDSVSAFQIQDLMFLDNTQSQVCWIAQDTIPGTFYGTNVCGDNTLRTYLRTGGLPAFSIDGVVPNPIITQSARVNLIVSEDGVPVTMQIFNALGQNVQTLMKDEPHAKGGYLVPIDASGLPSGLYTVFVSTPGYAVSKQILITR